ncbi:MAG: glutathione S-transferase C-terminal domain-containing protein, partial [Betaproteobacteria bacterium]|nr:glutathione S-transferase C-terminal domain-containing protein [Betaproteobacteria bacterium]
AEAVAYVDPLNDKLLTAILVPADQMPDAAAIDAAKKAYAEELARIEGWFTHDYVAGPHLSGADFTLYPYLAFLGRVDQRKPGYDLKAMLPPKTAAWMKRIEALPYFAGTIPPHWKS